ncbi:hypothetical protein HYH03_003336 [Edaphochlamys debaryana]|uniref:Flagellar associated protein n=1 Tax=Edaphochlamys debaryana TaxID=47281 RepID=A0A835Y951_9CHLO|nr:hypothetical protein HYH03_003336 [Edaphochlamys debaryana]|eukprot:KAG2498585.1 hypothetical protein HYH03_003336 [Edaphochlamys debaryana]
MSGNVTDYKGGVLISNWVEDHAKATSAPGTHILTHRGPRPAPPPISTQRLSYTPAGKTGEDLLEAAERHDRPLGIKGELLTRHGRFDAPPVQCLGTTYQLTHGRADGTDRKVQAYLWHGRKQNDSFVPHSTFGPNTMQLTARKQAEWASRAASADPYETTQRASTLPAALRTAESPMRTQSLRLTGDSGLTLQPANRPKGEISTECDKNYRRIGLRVRYRS